MVHSKIFNKSVAKSSMTSFRVELASYPDGSPIGIWVRAVNGINDGPTLTLLGAQHGDEYSGIEIINRIMDSVEPGELSGKILAIPVSNPLAFNTAHRITPPASATRTST